MNSQPDQGASWYRGASPAKVLAWPGLCCLLLELLVFAVAGPAHAQTAPVFNVAGSYIQNENDGPVLFAVFADAAPGSGIDVNIEITERDGSTRREALSFAQDETRKVIAVSAMEDDSFRLETRVGVRILAGTGYTVGDPGEAFTLLSDFDEPPSIVMSAPSSTTVAEGAPAGVTFRLSGGGPFPEPFTVRYTKNGVMQTIDIPAGATSVTDNAPVLADDNQYNVAYDAARNIPAVRYSLLDDPAYQITPTNIDFTVTDASEPPTVNLSAPLFQVNEGDEVVFQVRVQGYTDTPTYVVGTLVTRQGDVPWSVEIQAGTAFPATRTLEFTHTVPNDNHATAGSSNLIATFNDDNPDTYQLGRFTLVTIGVTDNDPALTDLPFVTISSVRSGASGIIPVFQASPPPSGECIAVTYTVHGSDPDTDGQPVEVCVTNAAGGTDGAPVPLPTMDNLDGYGDTLVFTLIVEGVTYRFGRARTLTASPTVFFDPDEPDYSLAAIPPTATEGTDDSILFTATSNMRRFGSPRLLPFQVVSDGLVLENLVLRQEPVPESDLSADDPQYSSVRHRYELPDDNLDQGTRTVNGLMPSGTDYTVEGISSGGLIPTQSVTVMDDDVPTISIRALTPSISEVGELARFEIVSTHVRGGSASRDIELAVSGVGGSPMRTASIEPGNNRAFFTMQADDNTMSDPDRRITVTVVDNDSGYLVADAPGNSATAYVVDDEALPNTDPRGVTISPTGEVSVAESGGTADYTMALDSRPTGDVSIRPQSADPAIASVSPLWLVFTQDNWNAPQTVTITGVNDDAMVDRTTTISHRVSGADYYSVPAPDVPVRAVNDDIITVTASIVAGDTPTEAGEAPGTFIVTLDRAVAVEAPIGIDVTGDARFLHDYTVAPVPLFIAAGETTATITITPIDDMVDDDAETVIFTLTSVQVDRSAGFLGMVDSAAASATLIITDNDERGVTVSGADDGITVDEDGGAADYTVVLESEPTDEVTIDVASDTETAATVSPNILTFTPANWNTAQTVTVTGVNDDTDGDRTATISHAVSGADYGEVEAASVTVTVSDDDPTPITASIAADATTPTEAGEVAGTFTVTLDPAVPADASASIAYDVSGTATGGTDYTITASPLTITAGGTTGTITVTPMDDGLDDDAETVVVTLTGVTLMGADDHVGRVDSTANSAMLIIADDDGRGVTVSGADAGVTVDEDGGTATYTVVLESEPTANVTIDVASDTETAATVSPNILTFTPANWDTAQTVTVTGVNDDTDGDRTATISHMVSGADYGGVEAASVAVTVSDDDPTPITASIAADATMPAEAGEVAGTFTVTLDPAVPTGASASIAYDVSGTATVGTDYTITASPLTIAEGGTMGTITVTPMDDGLDDDAETVIVTLTGVTLMGADDHAGMVDSTANSAMLIITDDDGRGVTVSAAGTGVTVAEDGGMATYTVALASQPTGDVSITVVSDNVAAATVSPNALMFTPANWDETQTVTVTGVNDDVDSANRSAIISHTASGADYGGVSVAGVTVTVTDDDDRGVTVSGSNAGVTVAEDGGTATYTVALESEPTANVTIDVASDTETAATVSPNILTFTPANWNVPQPVTVTGENDDVDSANRSAIIRHTASGADYGGVSAASVSVTVTDDDDRGVTVSAAGTGVTVAEDGGTADYTVVLESEPTGEVSITVASDNMAAATVSPGTLMFTSANWDMTQTVRVTGVNDDTDGDRTATISHAVSGADYEGVLAANVTVTVSDDDPTPITASIAADATMPAEAGTVAGTFTVTLAPAVPAGASARIAYTVSGTATGGTDYTITASPLTIAAGGTMGTITVTPMDDMEDDDAETVVVTLTGVTLTGADDYAGMVDGANTSAMLTITDDDATPITASIAADATTPTEAGPVAGTFTVTLAPAVPTGASASIVYEVSGTATDGTDYTITASPVTIDADGTTGTITVTPMDDGLDDDAETVVVTLTGVTLTGADDYEGMVDSANTSATLTITDDDGRGVDVSETEVTVAEAGGTADYTVVLASQPTGDVAITVVSDNMAAATVSPNALMFTPANWDTTQPVTVTGVNDDTNGDRTATIRHTVSGADYGGVSAAGVTVTVSDDDPTPITARITADATTPTEVGAVAGTFTVTLNQAVPAGASMRIMYDVGGTATQGTDYTITASPLTIAAGDTMGAITVTPVDDSPLQDDGETVVVTLTGAALTPADGYTAAVDGANASATLTIAEDLRRMERRDRGISMALSTVGQIVGWDTAESIRRRLGSGGQSGAPRLSGFPHSGLSPDSEPELTDFADLLRDGVGVDVALNARSGGGAAAGEVPLVQAWATASRSDFDNEPFEGRIQDGEGAVTRIGVDALYDSGWKVGVTVGKHNIELDFDDRAVNTTGAQDFDLMVLNPYVSYSRERRLAWGTVGIGNGEMNYREHSEGRIRRGSADLRLRGISGGFEYGLVTTGPLDLTGRGEAMAVRIDADESGASEVQFASRTDVYGARGEMEVGLSATTRGGLRVRPYALVGFRWDGGDLEDAVAAEYGGGIDVRSESFFVEASSRSQLDSDDENVHLTAWGLSFGYDRDGDHRGLTLDFSQNSGPSRYDPFDDGAGGVLPASAPAATAPLTATVRYGLGFRNGLLAPYHTRRYDGSAISSAETGVEYRVGVASWGLMHVYGPATDPDSGDSHSVNLTGRVNF